MLREFYFRPRLGVNRLNTRRRIFSKTFGKVEKGTKYILPIERSYQLTKRLKLIVKLLICYLFAVCFGRKAAKFAERFYSDKVFSLEILMSLRTAREQNNDLLYFYSCTFTNYLSLYSIYSFFFYFLTILKFYRQC